MNHIACMPPATLRKGWKDAPKSKQRLCKLKDFNLYCFARKIAEMICSYADNSNPKAPHMSKPVQDTPNPFFYQVANGLYLELLDRKPYCLWTPWGNWCFVIAMNDHWLDVMPEILNRLGATEYQPAYSEHCGPVYSLHKVDNIPLPEPMELARSSWDSFIGIMSVWVDLTNRYRANKS